MFGRPAQAAPAPPSPVTTPPPDRDLTGSREHREFEHASSYWGNQANFGLAGPPGRLGNLVADFWIQWWRPWALVGVLVVVLALVLIVSAVT
jgi:hypothetical protein